MNIIKTALNKEYWSPFSLVLSRESRCSLQEEDWEWNGRLWEYKKKESRGLVERIKEEEMSLGGSEDERLEFM